MLSDNLRTSERYKNGIGYVGQRLPYRRIRCNVFQCQGVVKVPCVCIPCTPLTFNVPDQICNLLATNTLHLSRYSDYKLHYFCLKNCRIGKLKQLLDSVEQCFSKAGPRAGTGPWHQLYRAARGSPGICDFSFF
jgi:hypothetical protein